MTASVIGAVGHEASPGSGGGATVGPNTILQIDRVLADRVTQDLRRSVFHEARLSSYLATPPEHMVPEADAARLFAAVVALLPAADAERVLREAGQRTAAYIVANRIPKPARRVLRLLPAFAGARLLLIAIVKHAWTFAGSGRVSIRLGRRPALLIAGNRMASPDCVWHTAVIEGLFRAVVSDRLRVAHANCCGKRGAIGRVRGDDVCRFEIRRSDM